LRVEAGVVECGVEVLEQVPLVREVVERTDSGQRAEVVRPGPLQQHRDAA